VKVGDLVKYRDPAGRWAEWRGIIVRCIPFQQTQIHTVAWTIPSHYKGIIPSSYSETDLEVISESR
jgi:hypothetical protein